MDHLAATNEEEKSLHLDAQAIALFNEVCNHKSAHEMLTQLQHYYERSTSTKNDRIEAWMMGEGSSNSNSNSDDKESIPHPHHLIALWPK